jgi:hypothetical protein
LDRGLAGRAVIHPSGARHHGSLTGYDNRDAVSGKPDEEVYCYDSVECRLSVCRVLRRLTLNLSSVSLIPVTLGDVYRYDAVTGVLVRVSVGEEGL